MAKEAFGSTASSSVSETVRSGTAMATSPTIAKARLLHTFFRHRRSGADLTRWRDGVFFVMEFERRTLQSWQMYCAGSWTVVEGGQRRTAGPIISVSVSVCQEEEG